MRCMERLRTLVSELRDMLSSFDASRLSADDAITCVDLFGAIARLGDAGRTLAAGRVSQTRAWRARGASSARAWLANSAGTTLGDASAMLETAARLDAAPVVRDAFIDGRLSTAQAAEISSAAIADPDATSSLWGWPNVSRSRRFVSAVATCAQLPGVTKMQPSGSV